MNHISDLSQLQFREKTWIAVIQYHAHEDHEEIKEKGNPLAWDLN